MDTGKNKKWEKTVGTKNPNISVHMNYTRHEDGTIRISAYAIDSQTGVKIDGASTKVRTARCQNDIPLKETYLISSVLAALPSASSGARKSRNAAADGAVSAAFCELVEMGDNIHPDWSPSTRSEHMTYFCNNILPHLAELEAQGHELTEIELETLKQALTQKALDSKKSKKNMRTVPAFWVSSRWA